MAEVYQIEHMFCRSSALFARARSARRSDDDPRLDHGLDVSECLQIGESVGNDPVPEALDRFGSTLASSTGTDTASGSSLCHPECEENTHADHRQVDANDRPDRGCCGCHFAGRLHVVGGHRLAGFERDRSGWIGRCGGIERDFESDRDAVTDELRRGRPRARLLRLHDGRDPRTWNPGRRPHDRRGPGCRCDRRSRDSHGSRIRHLEHAGRFHAIRRYDADRHTARDGLHALRHRGGPDRERREPDRPGPHSCRRRQHRLLHHVRRSSGIRPDGRSVSLLPLPDLLRGRQDRLPEPGDLGSVAAPRRGPGPDARRPQAAVGDRGDYRGPAHSLGDTGPCGRPTNPSAAPSGLP